MTHIPPSRDLFLLNFKSIFSSYQKLLTVLVLLSFLVIITTTFYISYKEDKSKSNIDKKITSFSNSIRNEKPRNIQFIRQDNVDLSSNPLPGLYSQSKYSTNLTDYYVEGKILEIKAIIVSNKKFVILKFLQNNTAQKQFQIVIPESLTTVTNDKPPSNLFGKEKDLDKIQIRLRYKTGKFEIDNLKEWDVYRYFIRS